MKFVRDSWRLMSTSLCGVMNMVACGVANSSFTQYLFHKTRKSAHPWFAHCEYSRCWAHVLTCCLVSVTMIAWNFGSCWEGGHQFADCD